MTTETAFKVELTVNGKAIEMNEFVHKIVGNSFLAMLKSIRLEEEPKQASLNIKIGA
jgi:hypothetical protein